MASYQDIESRLAQVERKTAFLLKIGNVIKRERSLVHPSGFVESQMSLLDLYHELNAQDLVIEPVIDAEVTSTPPQELS